MNIENIKTLFTYNYTLHNRLWASIEHLTEAQFVEDLGYSLGSVRNHMVHLMDVDHRWIARASQTEPDLHINAEDFPTRALVHAKWQTIEQETLRYINTLTNDDLLHPISFPMSNPSGMHIRPRWEILMHMVNHGTEHRVLVLQLLHHFKAPTFYQDFMLFQLEAE